MVRESKFNAYEVAFNVVVAENIDRLQCLPPRQFLVYWEQAWGGMTTVRISSTYKQYVFLTDLVQEVTDLMFRSGLLTGMMNPRYANASDYSMREIKNSFPFDIVMIKVPKNFLRKLVGY